MSARPGAIEYNISLNNFKGETGDISNIVAEFNIYEDIFSSVLKADILVQDAEGLPEAFPIVGDETINIQFKTDSSTDQVKLKFRVYTLADRVVAKEREHQYVLHAVSEEMFDNLLDYTNNYFVGKKPNEIVQAVFDEYLNKGGKKLEVETCINKFSATGARHHPFAFINLIATEAQSEEFPDSSFYIFYEDHIGFKFKSLNKLFNADPVEKYYLADPSAGDTMAKDKGDIRQYQIITALSFERSFDIMKGLTGGMLDTTVAYIDPIMKKYEESTFKYIADFDKLSNIPGSGGGKPILPKEGKFASTKGNSHMRMIATDFNDEGTQDFTGRISEGTDPHKYHSSKRWKWYHNGLALLQSLHQYGINITVPGNSNIKCGDIVNIFIPENSPVETDDAVKYLKLFGQEKAKFLVTAVLHNYKRTTGDYFTTIQGVKQSLDVDIKSQA